MGQSESIQQQFNELKRLKEQKEEEEENKEINNPEIVIKRQYLHTIVVSSYDTICCYNCPGKLATSIRITSNHLPIKGLKIECLGRDIGYGGLGNAKVMLIIQNNQNILKKSLEIITLQRINQNISIYLPNTHDILQDIQINDSIGIWGICFTGYGNQCLIENSSITLYLIKNWLRRKNALMFLYYYNFLKLSSQNIDINEVIDLTPIKLVFCNKDLCRLIIGFL